MADCKILIIDEDKDDVEFLSEAFIQCGVEGIHHVTTAMKAFIYLQEVESSCLPKLIIANLFLPGISGQEFLKDLKGMDKYKHIPVIIISSVKSDQEIERYREMGAEDYLIKPISYQDYVKVAADMKAKVGL